MNASDPSPGQVQATNLRQAKIALVGIFLLLLVGGVVLAKDFLVPVSFGYFIALTFRPTIHRLGKRGIPAWLSTLALALAVAGVVVVLLLVFGNAAAGWIADWPNFQRTFLRNNATLLDGLNQVLDFTQTLTDGAGTQTAPSQEVVVREPLLVRLGGYIAAYPVGVLITLSSAVVIGFFMMASGDLFYEKLIRILPSLGDRKNALRIVFDIESEVSNYLLTITAVNAGLATAVGFAFWLAGMPVPYFWALLAFLLNFIPYLGPIAGVTISAFVSFVLFPSAGEALLPPLVYICLIGLETQFITPAVLSRRMSVNTVSILLMLAFWGWAWGIPGIIMAVPFLVTLRVFCSHIEALKPLGEFLAGSGEGPISQPVEKPVPANGDGGTGKG